MSLKKPHNELSQNISGNDSISVDNVLSDLFSNSKEQVKIILGLEDCSKGETCINSLPELYNLIKSKQKIVIKKLKLDNNIGDNKLVRKIIDYVNKKTNKILFSELLINEIVKIIYDNSITDIGNRVLIKLTIIAGEIDESYILSLLTGIRKKKDLIDLIDFIGSQKMIALLQACDEQKLINYLNLNSIDNLRIEIEQSPKDSIKEIAKKINKTKFPAISKNKIFK